MRRTSWKWEGCETLWLDVMVAGKGWDSDGTGCSLGILPLPVSPDVSMTPSRKWNVYLGGSLQKRGNDGTVTLLYKISNSFIHSYA